MNARDLTTFEVDRELFAKLGRTASRPEAVNIAESGRQLGAGCRALPGSGADAVLVGEALVKDNDPRAAIELFIAAGTAAKPARPSV